MANTTLIRYGYLTVTLHDGENSIITESTSIKDSSLAIMPLYLSDSDETDVFDYGGAIKHINLNGIYIATSTDDLKTWIEEVESLQNGHQDKDSGYPLLFTDDLRGSVKVKCLNFSSTAVGGQPAKITWSLKLVESSENA